MKRVEDTNNNDGLHGGCMEEGEYMNFQLSQAKFRGALGALAVVSTVMLPIMGWQVVRYVDNLKEIGDGLGEISMKVAVLTVQVSSLQADVNSLETAIREPRARTGNYILPQNGEEAVEHDVTAKL